MSPSVIDQRNEHERAQELLIQVRVSPLPNEEQGWLEGHVNRCEDCGEEAEKMEDVMRQLRATPIFASRTLLRTTQARVRARAQEMHSERARTAPMLMASGMVVLFALLCAPFVWSGFSWAGDEFNLPAEVWQIGFLLFYLVPAGASVMLAVLHHRKAQEENARN